MKYLFYTIIFCLSLFFLTSCQGERIELVPQKTVSQSPTEIKDITNDSAASAPISSPHPLYKSTSEKLPPPFQYRGDLQRTGRTGNTTPVNPQIIMKMKADGKIRASAALLPDGGVVFGTLEGSLYILNSDGSLRNQVRMDSWIYCTPVVDSEGKIYAGCDNGDVVALTPEGEKLWKLNLRAETSSTPALFEGKLFMGAEDNALHAFNTEGKELWRFDTKKRILFSSPAVDKEKNIYVAAEDGVVYQIKQDGKPGWEFSTGDEISVCSPTLDAEGNIYIFSADGNIYSIGNNGALRWKSKLHEEVMGNLALSADGYIYAAALDGVVMKFDLKGKLKWKMKAAKGIKSSPVIDSKGNIVIAGEEGFFCLNSDGKQLWEIKKIDGKFSADPVISYNGTILLGGEDGFFYAVGAPVTSGTP